MPSIPPDNSSKFKWGHLYYIDELPSGDPKVATSISSYADHMSNDRKSRHWIRSVNWVENLLFTAGRHYVDDILVSRLTRDSNDNLSVMDEAKRKIPRPVNDLLGRYIETNIALFTENRPRPRITPKGDSADDQDKAMLSELTIEYLWESLGMPEMHREIARLILHCGICWVELIYDPLVPRRVSVPETVVEEERFITGPGGSVKIPVPQEVTRLEGGKPVIKETVEYGDITANLISPFEMHLPIGHYWNKDMDWVMREFYTPKQVLQDKYDGIPKKKGLLTKSLGWHLDRLEDVGTTNVRNLPIWWWERLSDLVEGPGPSLYVGTPEQWEGYTTVRIFDRKPNPKWPNGRTVITAGDQVLYDSPKDIGARAYNSRWPNRWHPYVRFRWEPMCGSMYGRSLVSKLLPKLKRVNAIDTTLIMWRRTVPIASWISPKGTAVVEDLWTGQPGCFTPNTFVLDCLGKPHNIESINLKTKIPNKESEGYVAEKFQYKVKDLDCITLTATGLESVTATPDHKIPVLKKNVLDKTKSTNGNKYKYSKISLEKDIVEVPIKEVEKGDWILSRFSRSREGPEKLKIEDYYKYPKNPKSSKFIHPRCKVIPPVIQIDEKFLRLLGLFLAEGCTTKHETMFSYNLQKEEKTLAKETEDLIYDIFGLTCRIEKINERNGINVVIASQAIAALFRALGGEGSRNKSIAEEIFKYPGSLLPLVGGWIDGDGSSSYFVRSRKGITTIKEYYTEGATTSTTLAYQIYSILLDEKISTRINRKKKTESCSLRWTGLDRKKLAPYSEKFKIFLDQKEKSYRQTSFWVNNFNLRRVNKVSNLKYSGKVFDLEVTGDHHYQANGIIAHNSILEYDPRRTAGKAPEPVFAPDYPRTILEERQQQLAEMEAIAGTEEVLRGQRPTGVTSGAFLEMLRKQALASRSSILQAWDESIQEEAGILLQEVIKNVKNDSRFAERIRILAREKLSRMKIQNFSGSDLSDNVIVKVDTASMALTSKEAREAKAIEAMQYIPGLMQAPVPLRKALLEELGWPEGLMPQGPDIERAKRNLGYIKQGEPTRAIPLPEDDPYVFYEVYVSEMKSDGFWDLPNEHQLTIIGLIDLYRQQIEAREKQIMAIQAAAVNNRGGGSEGG